MGIGLSRLVALIYKDKEEREMEKEIGFHLECEMEENVRRGMNPQEAYIAARRSFGGVEQFKEECRDVRRNRWLEELWQDVRYSLRLWRRKPAYTLLAILTLTLGIGANTAIFSVIYGVLIRPLPYQNDKQLVVLRQQAATAGKNGIGFSVKEIEDYRQQNQTLDELAEYHSMSFTLLGGAEPELIQTGVVSANFFDLLGVKPLYGRTFVADDEKPGADAVLVLGYDYWKRSHAGDPTIVGKVFRMNDRPHTVIGVLPPIPQYPNENDVYMPTSACPTRSSARFKENRNARMMSVFGRMKSDTSVAQAQSDIAGIAGHLQEQYPTNYPKDSNFAATTNQLKDELTRQARPTFFLLLGIAGLVLLIACANVANLTLARVMQRERELSLRVALGAGRRRIIRQLLTESVMLALVGGVFGVLLAAVSVKLLADFAARFTPRAGEINLNLYVLLFTVGISILTGLVFGLIPALSTRPNLAASMKEGSLQTTAGGLRNRLRSLLVVAQVAVSFVLLVGAGLMLRSFYQLQQVNPGFNPEKVLAMRVNANWSKYDTNQKFIDFSKRVLERVQTQSGITSAAMSNSYPLNPRSIANGPSLNGFLIEGQPVADDKLLPQADYRVISADYFHTLKIPLLEGRSFTASDDEKAPAVAIINQAFARHYFREENPLGKRLSFDKGEKWVTIVGVIADAKQYGLNLDVADEIYQPILQSFGGSFLLVRTITEPQSLIKELQRIIYEVDGETAIDRVQTLEEAHSEALASPRLTTMLLILFALVAVVITLAGIAGVMTLAVTQRTHELGIRLALGASPSQVLFMIVRQGMVLVVIGLGIGVFCAFQMSHFLSTLLFAVQPTDPPTFLMVSLLFVSVATLACLIPARRVTRIDPMIALKSE